ncbi:MAG: peptidoglycan -binding protein, partial [Acetobacteraceae bacterium]|nr:peptidoglycan -binding protein [Acetobacteraceae bacterium]
MALSQRRSRGGGLNAWPGYVDALSTLLMVIIFVLLVFVLAQAFLSVALSGRDRALDRLHRQVSEISDMLALERTGAADLRAALARLNVDLGAALSERDAIARQLSDARGERERLGSDLAAARGERDRLSAQLADLAAQGSASEARVRRLEGQLADALARTETQGSEVERAAGDLADLRRQLAAQGIDLARTREALGASRTEAASTAEAMRRASAELDAARRQIAALREQAASLDREVQVGRDTIAARLSDLAKLQNQVQALGTLRDQLEREAREAAARAAAEAAARAGADQQAAEAERTRQQAEVRAAEATRLSESAQAQAALLSRQLDSIRTELRTLNAALEASEAAGRDKDTQIANLGARLNTALAARVEELQRYRSDFFGRLRSILGDRPGIQIVGDRFVFQSEVLFPVGSAELSGEGAERIRDLAISLREIMREIPPDVHWVLRVDGHADNSPIRPGGQFASNWELSAARAVNVVRLLVTLGIPADRLAATAFGEFQPVDSADTPAARARNRR